MSSLFQVLRLPFAGAVCTFDQFRACFIHCMNALFSRFMVDARGCRLHFWPISSERRTMFGRSTQPWLQPLQNRTSHFFWDKTLGNRVGDILGVRQKKEKKRCRWWGPRFSCTTGGVLCHRWVLTDQAHNNDKKKNLKPTTTMIRI